MSEQKIFIAGYIPDDKSVEEFGARRVATAFNAKDMKHAQAKASFLFMEEYPGSQDAAYKILVCEDTPEVTRRPVRDVWDEKFLYENDWDEKLGYPVAREAAEPQPIEFDKLSKPTQLALLVKYQTTENITHDMMIDAMELRQEDENTFLGHILAAIDKTPAVASMFPERIIEAVQYLAEKCPAGKKWPEIKAQLANWHNGLKKSRDGDDTQASQGSGNPDRFDLVVAMLTMGINPADAGATDVKNAKHIKDTRDPAWRAWRTTLVGIPGIYTFPESELYELTLDGMKDLKLIKDDAGRLSYVREHFAGHELLPDYQPEGEADEETEQKPQNATGALADAQASGGTVESQQSVKQPQEAPEEVTERQGPFYFLFPDGEKFGRANKLSGLKKALADGCTEISQEEYQARKTGTYTAPSEDKQDSETSDEVGKQLAASRGDYVEGISDPDDPKWVRTETANQPDVQNHGNGVLSVDGLLAEQPKADAPAASNEVEKTEVTAVQPAPSTFQSIGAALENDLAEKGDNMKIWRSVMRTDPRYTKDLAGAGFEGTSINAEYMIMRATEIFGPIGTGWGFEVLEDRMIPGAPMSEAIYEDKKFIGNRLLRDADGTLITEQNHSIKIAFWYLKDDGVAERFEAYGATKYLYKTKHGITCDGEAQKKSLTDAIKKALSLLGFSADVWLGLYDQAEYKQENATEFAIKNASEKAEDVTRLRDELDEKLTRVANTIERAVSTNEAKKVFDTIAREVEVHRKAAEAKGDSEHAKYLSGRLRRLNEIKNQRIEALTDAEASNA